MKLNRASLPPLLIALVSLLMFAPMASAANRYATPTGSGVVCTVDQPCGLVEAVNNAPDDSDIFVASGTYGSALTPINVKLEPGDGSQIRGASSTDKPVVYSSATWSFQLYASSGRQAYLGDIELQKVDGGYGIIVYGVVERVVSIASNSAGSACSPMPTGAIRDSLCVGHDGASAMMISAGGVGQTVPDVNIFNTTAIATGSGTGLLVSLDNYSTALNIRNSIIRAAGDDIRATASDGANATLRIDHSNFGEIVPSVSSGGVVTLDPTNAATNQTAQLPLFVNAAADDYRQLDTSPTVDAGIDNSENGPFDALGAARTQGARTDIGTFESSFDTTPAPAAPVLSKFKQSRRKFKAARRGATIQPASAAKKRSNKGVGMTISLTSSGQGVVFFTLFKQKKVRGKKVWRRVKGDASATLAAGVNRFWFSGRWNRKRLSPGTYQLRGGPTIKDIPRPPSGDEPGTLKGPTSILIKK